MTTLGTTETMARPQRVAHYCGRKVCTGPCGRWRHILDFPPRKRRSGTVCIHSHCHACHRLHARLRKARDPQRRAVQHRVSARRCRRAAGVPERGPVYVSTPKQQGVVDRLPFANFLREVVAERGSVNKAAEAVEMNPKRVFHIINGYYQVSRSRPGRPGRVRKFYPLDWVEFDVVDRALMAYGQPWLLDELYPIGEDA